MHAYTTSLNLPSRAAICYFCFSCQLFHYLYWKYSIPTPTVIKGKTLQNTIVYFKLKPRCCNVHHVKTMLKSSGWDGCHDKCKFPKYLKDMTHRHSSKRISSTGRGSVPPEKGNCITLYICMWCLHMYCGSEHETSSIAHTLSGKRKERSIEEGTLSRRCCWDWPRNVTKERGCFSVYVTAGVRYKAHPPAISKMRQALEQLPSSFWRLFLGLFLMKFKTEAAMAGQYTEQSSSFSCIRSSI